MCGIIIYPNVFSALMNVGLINRGFYEVLEKQRLVHRAFWSDTIRYSKDKIIKSMNGLITFFDSEN